MASAARSTVNTANPFGTAKQSRRLDVAAGRGYDHYDSMARSGAAGWTGKPATNLAGGDYVRTVGGAEPPERPV
jgi:hypothetical protein